MTAPLIWVLRDGRPGTAAQALGVAEALGRPFVEKPLVYDGLAKLPNLVRGASLIGIDAATRASLTPPWPDVVIAAGRRAAPVARWIKAQSGRPVLLAQIMNPGRVGADDFDLIALPHHDCQVPGGDAHNVLRITGAPHRVTPARLAEAAESWRATLDGLPRPWIAVLVGGATRQRPFPRATAEDLAAGVSRMAQAVHGSVLLLTSRRTGAEAEARLIAKITAPTSAFLWGQGGDNPYLGFLGLADAVVVTGDSVSMCCEAAATPAPVFIYAPPGLAVPKHERLHRELYAGGYARPFDGSWAEWNHPALNAAGDVAAALARLIPPHLV
jgi:mitochondrial fission protein ELM1